MYMYTKEMCTHFAQQKYILHVHVYMCATYLTALNAFQDRSSNFMVGYWTSYTRKKKTTLKRIYHTNSS